MASSNEAGFNLRETTPPSPILHDLHGNVDGDGDCWRRSRCLRRQANAGLPAEAVLGHLIYPMTFRDSAKSGSGCIG
jgi:hypothetical protein